MIAVFVRRRAAWVALVALGACSPALNWREVRLERLVALLPCKPDHAQRTVPLGTQEVAMQMSGCEAGGGLYAISHVRVADAALVDATQTAWRQASLAQLQDASIQIYPFRMAKPRTSGPVAGPSPHMPVTGAAMDLLHVQAKHPDGGPLQARLLWVRSGADVYHVALYGPRVTPEMSDLLFSELVLQ